MHRVAEKVEISDMKRKRYCKSWVDVGTQGSSELSTSQTPTRPFNQSFVLATVIRQTNLPPVTDLIARCRSICLSPASIPREDTMDVDAALSLQLKKEPCV